MDRYPQSSGGHGSLRDIQLFVNGFPELFVSNIKEQIVIKSERIDWVSPLKDDDYAEYRDSGFIEKLGIQKNLIISLSNFWPKRGPQWDALGRGEDKEVFLVEAKANIEEIVSPETKATGKALDLIKKSLDASQKYLKVNNKAYWSGTFYQYTNRLAHLYFLRTLNKLPAYLIFVYFIGDDSVSGPKSMEEWKAALKVMKRYLGLSTHKLAKYIAEVFIDVKQIGL
ncbi:MAG: hypothetical protein A2Y66_03885 [Nitrospirae bacterium RBG_13_41_22]|nr:MAG: hypothetical protein A2Y66_03885 [Nitrospirae bacterium RBG_13_41_22]